MKRLQIKARVLLAIERENVLFTADTKASERQVYTLPLHGKTLRGLASDGTANCSDLKWNKKVFTALTSVFIWQETNYFGENRIKGPRTFKQ